MALLYLSIHKKVRYVVILDLVTIMKVQPDNFQRIHFTVLVVLDQFPDRGMTVIRTPASNQSQTHLAVTVIHKQLIETKMQSERLQRHGCDSHNMIAGTTIRNNLQPIVETINDEIGRRRLGHETRFVLLHDILFRSGQSRNVVNIRHTLVGTVGHQLASDGGVKTGHLEVDTNVGVIDIDNLSTAQEANVFVIANSVGRHDEGHAADSGRGSGRQEIAAIR
jgi:hypothetical protein